MKRPKIKVQTTVGYVDAFTYVMTILAILPYTLGNEAAIIPDAWKSKIAAVGIIAGAILKIVRGHTTPDTK